MPLAPIYIKGRGDTYNLRAANRFLWENVGDASGAVDFHAMHDWWQGLIALRLSEAGEVFRVGETPPEGWVQFFAPEAAPQALGWMVGGQVLVLVNAGDAFAQIPVDLPDGWWKPVAISAPEFTEVRLEGIDMSHGRITMGGESVQNTSAHSVTIMVRE